MIKKILSSLICAVILISLCACSAAEPTADGDGRIKIVATLFPQYDFARNICGERADVTLLLPPGVESHSYDPTPADILDIVNCDLFIYTGDEMEPWAAELLKGAGENVRVLDLSQSVEIIHTESEHEHEHAGHHHETDPHIWTSPVNAQLMTRAIADELCAAFPEDAEQYAAAAESYCAQLGELDRELRAVAADAKRSVLVFGGRFAFGYLTEEYGFDWIAAYDSCSHESEPSVHTLTEIIGHIREENIPVVYYEELCLPSVAETISGETGARLLLLHSCHNLSADETAAGETYISIMKQNIINLREGLC